jgi:hypothetical protein
VVQKVQRTLQCIDGGGSGSGSGDREGKGGRTRGRGTRTRGRGTRTRGGTGRTSTSTDPGAGGLVLDRTHDGGIGRQLGTKGVATVSCKHVALEDVSERGSACILCCALRYILLSGTFHAAVGLGALPRLDLVLMHDVGFHVSKRLGPVGALLAQAGEGEGVGGHVD